VHYKEDLRFAIRQAHLATKLAKDLDGDALTIAVIRRSGEHTSVVVPWDMVDSFRQTYLQPFLDGATDRWLYALQAVEPTLCALPRAAIRAEIGRLAARASNQTQARIDPEQAVALWETYQASMEARNLRIRAGAEEAIYLADYLTIGQTLSFLARGKD
jgi:CRISPR-associated protein Cmr2